MVGGQLGARAEASYLRQAGGGILGGSRVTYGGIRVWGAQHFYPPGTPKGKAFYSLSSAKIAGSRCMPAAICQVTIVCRRSIADAYNRQAVKWPHVDCSAGRL